MARRKARSPQEAVGQVGHEAGGQRGQGFGTPGVALVRSWEELVEAGWLRGWGG